MRLLGFLLLALALGLLVAAPLIGQIPLGVAVSLMGLGLVERDVVIVAAGLAIGLAGMAVNVGFAYALLSGLERLLWATP
jgi:hypothetical protein